MGALLALCVFPRAAMAPHASSPVPAQDQLPRLQLDSAGTRIWLEGDATLGRFEAHATRFSGWAELPDTTTFAGAGGRVVIDAASFKTGNGMRDGHLRGELKVDRFPDIVFVVGSVAPADAAVVDSALAPVAGFNDGTVAVPLLLAGSLTVRDSTREVRIPVRASLAGDTLRVRGRLTTSFRALGMKPPTKLLGTVKVKDDIVLVFDASFRRSGR